MHLVTQELWGRCTVRFMFHTCQHNIHPAAHRLRSNFSPQALLFTKCISYKAIAAIQSDPSWWIWAKSTENLLEKIHHSRCHEGHSWFMGFMGSNTNISRSLEEVDWNPQGRLCRVQDFSGERNCRCGRNSKRTRIRNGVWIAEISWSNLNGCGAASYGWAEKVVS